MHEPTAMGHFPLAVSPAVPVDRTYNCKCTTHSGTGLYEITLDDGINSLECIAQVTAEGAVADCSVQLEHVSDTVKRVRTFAAGVLVDTFGFNAIFYRLPAGHP